MADQAERASGGEHADRGRACAPETRPEPRLVPQQPRRHTQPLLRVQTAPASPACRGGACPGGFCRGHGAHTWATLLGAPSRALGVGRRPVRAPPPQLPPGDLPLRRGAGDSRPVTRPREAWGPRLAAPLKPVQGGGCRPPAAPPSAQQRLQLRASDEPASRRPAAPQVPTATPRAPP